MLLNPSCFTQYTANQHRQRWKDETVLPAKGRAGQPRTVDFFIFFNTVSVSEEKMAEVDVLPSPPTPNNGEVKEYQTLFWVPMLFQTAKSTELLIEEMLDMIQDFHDEDMAANRKSFIQQKKLPGQPKRRQQILGDTLDSEAAVTRVDVILKSENTKFILLTVLKRHFLFSQLRDYELEDVIDVMQAQYVNEGEVIIQQGDHGELFYILEEGTCQILIDSESLGMIESGSSFGDLALMYNCPRAATIIAITDCTLWTLDRVFFRQAMVTSSSNQNVQLSQFLSKISLFASLGVQQLNQLARSLTKQTYEDGQYIIRQGDMGDQFYVIYKGKVLVSKTDDSGKEDILLELGEGEVFGERALIKKEPRKANVIAKGVVECYYLESHDFYSMLGEFVEKFNKMNEFRIIRSAKIFNRVNDAKLKEFITTFRIHRMFSGQRLVCGINEIFIVIDGQFKANNPSVIDRYASDGNVEIGNLEHTADEIAGALTLLSDEGMLLSFTKEQLLEVHKKIDEEETIAKAGRRGSANLGSSSFAAGSPGSYERSSSTMISKSKSMLDLANSNNDSLLTPTMDNEKEIYETEERRKASTQSRKLALESFSIKSLSDLNIGIALGKGTFGNVYYCQKQDIGLSSSSSSHDIEDDLEGFHTLGSKGIALKCLKKKEIIENNQYIYVQREIIALQTFQHPFITDYYGYLLSRSRICIMLEYIPGGEFWSYLYDDTGKIKTETGSFGGLPIETAVLYAANIILALEHIHDLGYIYRDLKPGKICLDLFFFFLFILLFACLPSFLLFCLALFVFFLCFPRKLND
jgi:CRP-like cAMP-binding protein